jgi:tRNA (cmo5U34)-methyltransferase
MSGWVFDEAVAERFDDEIERSVPGYADMRAVVNELLEEVVPEDMQGWHRLLDIGSSRGGVAERILASRPNLRMDLVESSPAMAAVLRQKYGTHERVRVIEHDVVDIPLGVSYTAATSVLTAMFVPVQHRARLFQQIRTRLIAGPFILVEKVTAADVRIDNLLRRAHHARKEMNGYRIDEIEKKEDLLSGVLVPLTAKMNEQLLCDAGFTSVEVVWASLNFRAWAAYR